MERLYTRRTSRFNNEICWRYIIGTVIAVKQSNFRESICKPCQELFDKGYIDTNKPAIFGNVLGNVRFSNYLS